MEFHKLFAKLCNEKGESPNTVCAKLGLSNATYSYWKKNGNTPRETTLIKIAEYFGVSVEYLLEKTTPEQNTSNLSGDPISAPMSEFSFLFEQLTKEQQAMILASMKGILSEQKGKEASEQ